MTDLDEHMSAEIGAMCLIALDEADDIFPRLLRRAFAHFAPRSLLGLSRVHDAGATHAFTFEVDGNTIGAAVIDGQMPAPEWKVAAAHSLFWPDAMAAMSGHRGYIALGAEGRYTALGLARAQAVALTRLAAALMEVMPSQGLYWRGAETCAPPDRVARAAYGLGQGKWPVDLWVGWTHFARDAATPEVVGLQTRGAKAYLGYELEVPPATVSDPKEPLRILFNTAGYLMDRGTIVVDGQWVEVTGERRTRFTLHHGRDGAPRIARLSLPDATAPQAVTGTP